MRVGHSRTKPIRARMRKERGGLSQAQQLKHARAAAQHLKQSGLLSRINNVAVYLDFDGELGTGPLIKTLRASGKKLFVPVLDAEQQSMIFTALPFPLHATHNRFGIREPMQSSPLTVRMDALIVPLTAFDTKGRRLGMGGGYYDRYLASRKALIQSPSCSQQRRTMLARRQHPKVLIGWGHEMQRLSSAALQAQSWDIDMDWVGSERGLHQCVYRRS